MRGREPAAHLVAYPLKVQYSERRNTPSEPFAIPFLFSDGIAEQRKELQLLHVLQWFKVADFGYIIVRERECREVWYRKVEGCGYGRYSVVRKKKGAEAAEERDVSQNDDGVVGKVNNIMLVLEASAFEGQM